MWSSRFQLDHLLVWWEVAAPVRAHCEALTRLYEPSEGVIRIDGHDISKVDLYSLRAQIGVVPQDSLPFDAVFTPTLR